MMSVKIATLGILKKSYFEIMVMISLFLSMTSPTNFF